jgi:hypothetical protein
MLGYLKHLEPSPLVVMIQSYLGRINKLVEAVV